MSQVEKTYFQKSSWQERDAAVRQEYARLCDTHEDDRDHLIRSFMKNLLQRILYLGCNHPNPLPQTPNSIRNYDLNRLSKNFTTSPDSVRSARFKDGLFYSFRIREGTETVLQHDFCFYNPNESGSIPRIVSRLLRDYGDGQIIQSFLPPKYPLEDSQLFQIQVPSLIMNTLGLVDQEASSNPAWPTAYSSDELRSVRYRTDVRHVQKSEIKYNPELSEPYL